MSIKALDWAMDQPIKDPLAKLMLICIANHYNDSKGIAWPSVPHLCHITGASEATVRRKLKKLEELGLIGRHHRHGRSTEYTMAIGTPVTVIPLSHRQDTPVTQTGRTNKKPLNNISKAKLVRDWEGPTDEDKQFAAQSGYDWKAIWDEIKDWESRNADKNEKRTCYKSFWRNWIKRKSEWAKERGHSVQAVPVADRQSSMDRVIGQWDALSAGMRERYLLNRPDIKAELKKMGKV